MFSLPLWVFSFTSISVGLMTSNFDYVFLGLMFFVLSIATKMLVESDFKEASSQKKIDKLEKDNKILVNMVSELKILNSMLRSGPLSNLKSSPTSKVDPYWSVLGIEPTKDKIKINSAYKDLMQIHHPDKRGEKGVEITKKINGARNEALKYAGK